MIFGVLNDMSQTYTVTSPPDAALSPPPGIVPDFQDPFSLRPYYNVTASLGLVSTGIILGLRLYTKIAVVKECRWEDCKFTDPVWETIANPRLEIPARLVS